MEPLEPFDPEYKDVPVASTNGNAWLAPAKLPEAQAAAVSGPPPLYDLRPLTTGEVLDRTFSVYRSRFWLFAGIAAISGAVQLVAQSSQMVFQHLTLRRAGSVSAIVAGVVVMVIVYLLFFLAYSVTMAATAFAVSEVYLGRPTTIASSMRATIGRWYAYIAIALWQIGSFIWLPLLVVLPAVVMLRLGVPGLKILGGFLIFVGGLGGFVAGYFFYLRNSLAVPATVVEQLSVRASMRRSKVLMPGAKARIFLVGVISGCLYMVVGVVQAPLAFVMMMAMQKGHESIAAQAGTLLIGFVGHSVVMPVAMIGYTLVYFDQRVRKEAFDLVVLLGHEEAVVAGLPVMEDAPAVSGGRVDDGALL